MRLIRGLHNLSVLRASSGLGCVATIGNFDGVHRGHQRLIQHTLLLAQQQGLPSGVIVFEPQPREYFTSDGKGTLRRLMNLSQKVVTLADYSIDFVLCLYFDRALSLYSPEAFVKSCLVQALKVKHLVVGEDFRFGFKRSGGVAELKQLGHRLGFKVCVPPTLLWEGRRVSSSWLRASLETHDLALWMALTGRPYWVTGHVVGGDQLARQFGFPTANIFLKGRDLPLQGVYVVTVVRLSASIKTVLRGVANMGYRPTVGGTRFSLEVHLLDFDEMIYGEKLKVTFQCKLRGEKKFDSIEALKSQINRDVEAARMYFLPDARIGKIVF